MIACRMLTLAACLMAALLAGCSRLPDLEPVSGRVTLDGKPLEFGCVMFQPEKGPAAVAPINRDGRFTLTYQCKAAGAVVGRNRVVVTAYEAERPGFQWPAGGEPGLGKCLVPQKYTSASTTDLEIDVRPGMGDAELALSSKP
jgi:hypothetical protein